MTLADLEGSMFCSYYVIVAGPDNLFGRFDYADFCRAFKLYRSCRQGYSAQLYGVDGFDRSIRLGEYFGA